MLAQELMVTINTANKPKKTKMRFISTCLRLITLLLFKGKLGKNGSSEEKRKDKKFIVCPLAGAKIKANFR
jgi:hypothetical protein